MIPTPAPDPTEATAHHMESAPLLSRTRVRSNRILIRPDSPEKMIGSIIKPDNTIDEGRHWSGLTCRTARVLAMGPGLYIMYSKWIGHCDEHGVARWPMPPLRPGSRLLFRAWSGNDVVIDDEKLQIIPATVADAEILPNGDLELFEDRLLVRRRKPLQQSRGGIWIPETSQKSPLEGEVIQTGPGKVVTNGTTRPFDTKPGDRVAWRPMKGVDVSKYVPHLAKRDEILMLFETDLIGVIEGEGHFEPVVSLQKEQ